VSLLVLSSVPAPISARGNEWDALNSEVLSLPLYQRALAIREKSLGPNHPQVAATLESLATLCRATNRVKDAEEFESKAARIRDGKR
jgi:hypothetical protein